jgi:hypothetical protein
MTDTPAATAAQTQPTLQDHIGAQKQVMVQKAQELVNISHNIIDSWITNFNLAEKVKGKRTEQVNVLLGFVNQLANEGVPAINALGNEIKDAELSNKILECNNTLMSAARNALNNIQQQEAAFQKEIQAQIAGNQPAALPKTEVKVQEA